MSNEIIAVIPALNPGEVLIKLIYELKENGFKKIVVINDGSYDNTTVFTQLEKISDVDVLKNYVNLGKGRALKTGFNYILNNYAYFQGVITIDADGQHKIGDIIKCAEALSKCYQENQIVLGCRQFTIGNQVPLRSRFGNICTQYVLRYLCNVHVSDSQTGLRGIPMNMLPDLMRVVGEGYEYETNMLLQIVEMGGVLQEVPIETVYENNNNTSHFNPIKDSLRIYSVIIKYSLASLISAIVDNITFIILSSYFSNIYAMTFLGRAVSAVFNFTINRGIVFKEKGNVFEQSVKYLILLVISGSISAFCVSTLYQILHVNIIFLKLMIELILYFFNFYIQKNFIFVRGKKNVNKNS